MLSIYLNMPVNQANIFMEWLGLRRVIGKVKVKKLLFLQLIWVVITLNASAQEIELPKNISKNGAMLDTSMKKIAKQALLLYEEPNHDKYLNTLFRLQTVAGQYSKAAVTLQHLTKLRRKADPTSSLTLLPFDVVTKAREIQSSTGINLNQAFVQVFRDFFADLDNKTASKAIYWFGGDLERAHNTLNTALEKQKGKNKITLADALDLIRHYQFYQDFQVWQPLVGALIAEDDGRRYIVDKDILIETPDGAHIAAMVVRPKSIERPIPALLNFTIYTNEDKDIAKARESAAHGYVGAVAYTRGKGRSPDTPVPYEYDGTDANVVINWLSKQLWSDGRVGMFGGSYDGFTQWAAAKHLPSALKTIVPYVANNPGDGLPMENNIFLLVNYAWAFYTTNNKTLDNEIYNDRERWRNLNDKWYESGKSYRQVDRVDGLENKWLQRWLLHPSYDEYWQSMVPYKNEFSKINIPVLTITGYYDDGQQSALHYLKEHYKYNPNADHYLLIGPYDHFGAQASGKPQTLRNYTIDPVADFDTAETTYQWMDYVFRGAERPELLKDKINYQVMGTNTWKHAPSLAKQYNETLTLYLRATKLGEHSQLSLQSPSKAEFLSQKVDFSDRKTSNNDYYPYPIVGKKSDLSSGYSFISEPFDEPVEISGTFSGEIKATINKKDMDIGVVLYEVMPNGELFHLSYFLGRASYAKNMSVRRLLTPDTVESIPFDKTRMVSRKLSKGSRLLVTLNINKNPFAQINYGTGKDVSDEDISDAKVPLQIKWHSDSYVNIPIVR